MALDQTIIARIDEMLRTAPPITHVHQDDVSLLSGIIILVVLSVAGWILSLTGD